MSARCVKTLHVVVFALFSAALHVLDVSADETFNYDNGTPPPESSGLSGSSSEPPAVLDSPPYDLAVLREFCRCDSGTVPWRDFIQSHGHSCFVTHGKIPPQLFADVQHLFTSHLRGNAEEQLKCPAGALTVGTAVGGIWEAHDLGEQNFYDMEDWPAIWGRYAVHVRASMAEGQAGGGGPHGVICMVDGL